jgi:hypothetical protein
MSPASRQALTRPFAAACLFLPEALTWVCDAGQGAQPASEAQDRWGDRCAPGNAQRRQIYPKTIRVTGKQPRSDDNASHGPTA